MSKICPSGLSRNELLYYIVLCQYSHKNPDEYAAMLAMLNRRCSLLIVHNYVFNRRSTLNDLSVVASARCNQACSPSSDLPIEFVKITWQVSFVCLKQCCDLFVFCISFNTRKHICEKQWFFWLISCSRDSSSINYHVPMYM